jgi:hypothetical protein
MLISMEFPSIQAGGSPICALIGNSAAPRYESAVD